MKNLVTFPRLFLPDKVSFRIPVPISETCVFSSFSFIYHSNSHDVSQVYVYLNAFSLYHLRTGNNMWETIRTDRLTARNLRLRQVVAHNSQIARLAVHNLEIIWLATFRIATHKHATHRFTAYRLTTYRLAF